LASFAARDDSAAATDALAVALGACGSSATSGTSASGSQTSAAPGGTAAAKPSGTLVVFAATSLTDAFNKIATQFEAANPGVNVKFNYNGSSTLATQITQGAPADVFASAAREHADRHGSAHDLDDAQDIRE
jgi:molybdate transport system substrate-binding protein